MAADPLQMGSARSRSGRRSSRRGSVRAASLENLIERCVEALAKAGDAPAEYVPPKTPITAREAGGFFRAVDAGLFDLSEDGMCRPRRMRPSTGYCYPLFLWASKAENRVTICAPDEARGVLRASHVLAPDRRLIAAGPLRPVRFVHRGPHRFRVEDVQAPIDCRR